MHRLRVDFQKPDNESAWSEKGFREDLESALHEICPAAKLVVDEGTDEIPLKGHVELELQGLCLTKYCAHQAGCNLLIDLTRETTRGGNLPTTTISQGVWTEVFAGEESEVTWRAPYYLNARGLDWPAENCPDLGCDWCFYKPHPPAALLAHELIHAWHHQIGEYCQEFGAEAPEEICTVQSENQLRWEMGKPARCSYMGTCLEFPSPDSDLTWQVPAEYCDGGAHQNSYDCVLLRKTEDRGDCGCSSSVALNLTKAARRILCWVKGIILHPVSGIGKRHFRSPDWKPESGFEEMFGRHLSSLPEPSHGREMEALAKSLVRARIDAVDGRLEKLLDRTLQELVGESRESMVFEALSVHGAYDLIAQFSLPSETLMVTTLGYPSKARKPPSTSRAPVKVFSLEPGERFSVGRFSGDDPELTVPEGIGGTFEGTDGGAEFLQLKSPNTKEDPTAVATRNLGIAASSTYRKERGALAPEDVLRWEAMKEAMRWGQRTLERKRRTSKPGRLS